MYWALFINFKILKTMIYLTILNTLAIIYLITAKKSKYYLRFKKETTTYENTLLGFRLSLWQKVDEYSASYKKSIYFKIRDRKKTEMQEEARRMIAQYSQQKKLQSLSAKFSWLKTWDEVKEFQKYYTCVDQKIVENLVSKFVPNVS
jgi:hypothetical protein